MTRKKLVPVHPIARTVGITILLFALLFVSGIAGWLFEYLPGLGWFDFVKTLLLLVLLFRLVWYFTTATVIEYDENYIYITNKLRSYSQAVDMENVRQLTLHPFASFRLGGNRFWGCTLQYVDNEGVADKVEFHLGTGAPNFDDFITTVQKKNPQFLFKKAAL